mgnify:CR=1 FL=1
MIGEDIPEVNVKKTPEFRMEDQVKDILDILNELKNRSDHCNRCKCRSGSGTILFYRNIQEKVEYLLMYEPAMLGNMMQEEETFKNWAEETEELIRKRKYNMALLRFSKHIGYQDPRSPQKSEEVSLRELDNVEYAFNKEIPVLLRYYPDIDKMNQHADKITIAAGEKSEDSVYVQAAIRLAAQIGKKVVYYPGGIIFRMIFR